MCVTPQALLSALVVRMEREGVALSAAELTTLRSAGCTDEDLAKAFSRGAGPAFDEARRLLTSIRTPG